MKIFLSIVLSFELVCFWAMPLYALGATSLGGSSISSSTSTIESGQSNRNGDRDQNRSIGGGVKFQKNGSELLTGIFLELEQKRLNALFLHTGIGFLRVTNKLQKQGVTDGEIFAGYSFIADSYAVTPYSGLNYLGSQDQGKDSNNQYLMGVVGVRVEKELETYLLWGVDTKLKRSIVSRFGTGGMGMASSFQVDVPFRYHYAQSFFSFVPTYQLLQKKRVSPLSLDKRQNEVGLKLGYHYQF